MEDRTTRTRAVRINRHTKIMAFKNSGAATLTCILS